MFDRLLLLASMPLMLASTTFAYAVRSDKGVTVITEAAAATPLIAARPIARIAGPATTITRDADGMFRVALMVDGRPVRAIVDTGATRSVLSATDAAGQTLRAAGMMATFNGAVPFSLARAHVVQVGSRPVGQVDFAVLGHAGQPYSVIGQDVLRRMGPVTIDGDRLTFHAI